MLVTCSCQAWNPLKCLGRRSCKSYDLQVPMGKKVSGQVNSNFEKPCFLIRYIHQIWTHVVMLNCFDHWPQFCHRFDPKINRVRSMVHMMFTKFRVNRLNRLEDRLDTDWQTDFYPLSASDFIKYHTCTEEVRYSFNLQLLNSWNTWNIFA